MSVPMTVPAIMNVTLDQSTHTHTHTRAHNVSSCKMSAMKG